MNDFYYNFDLVQSETKAYIETAHKWADQEHLAQQLQRPRQFGLVRLAVVVIAASIIAALLMAGI